MKSTDESKKPNIIDTCNTSTIRWKYGDTGNFKTRDTRAA
jgi:hypothetical protein